MADFASNPWIQFLRQYSPIPRNENMYDETIRRILRRTKVQPIRFEVPYLPGLITNFKQASPKSIILTGTAGDGKTCLCRMVWESLGGDPETWDDDGKVRRLSLPQGKGLVVIKDLSELKEEDRSLLTSMAAAICGQNADDVFLLAANDGQLVEAWSHLADSSSVVTVRQLIEDLLVAGRSSDDKYALCLHNLSQTSAAQMFEAILSAVLDHPGWAGCSECLGTTEGRETRCPIHENYLRLKTPLFRARLRDLLELCDHNDYHLPIRQLMLLISNVLLGHPEAKDGVLRCIDVPKIIATGDGDAASPYSNVFGMNLPATRRDALQVFEVLARFGIGEETSNQIDTLLMFGGDDAAYQPLFKELIASDSMYGATPAYYRLQKLYLEG